MPNAEGAWFANGLRFTCTRCSRCCRHESGYVFLSERDIQRLCAHFSLAWEAFIQKYCKQVNFDFAKRISLNEQENFDCIFWKDGICSVYEARPLQCRSYPFWPHHLESAESWNALEKECPGINIGKRHSSADVYEWIDKRKNDPFSS